MDVDLSDPQLGQTRGTLACGNCGCRLTRLPLTSHYGQSVDLDLCGPCHLVWFDTAESVRLPGTALLELLAAMARLQAEPHHPLREQASCPRCSGRLKRVHNRSRWGPTLQLECRQGHGAWQTFAQFLSEKGLIRTLSSADRAHLSAGGASLVCLNCGAPLGNDDAHCRFCRSVPGLLDVARMARALDPEGATQGEAAHRLAPAKMVFNCHACGASVAQAPALHCSQCGATLACTGLVQAYVALKALGPALLQHHLQPTPQTVARRLDALRSDVPRRRDWIREVAANADGQLDLEFSLWARLLRWLTRRID